jgi:hypothetical protein
MSLVLAEDAVTVWVDADGFPERLVWNGARYRVTDPPTPLADLVLGLMHPAANRVDGWRLRAAPEGDGKPLVFDVTQGRSGWSLAALWEQSDSAASLTFH